MQYKGERLSRKGFLGLYVIHAILDVYPYGTIYALKLPLQIDQGTFFK